MDALNNNFAQFQAMNAAINQNQAMMQQQRARLLQQQNVRMEGPGPERAQAGTLYVHDSFVPSNPEQAFNPARNPHGIQVARSARRQGFQGQIVGSENSLTRRQQTAFNHRNNLSTPNANREQVLRDIRGYTENITSGLLDGRSDRLDQLRQRGARNSSVNFSQGESRASTTSALYDSAARAWSPDPSLNQVDRLMAGNAVDNYARAFGLDAGKLRDSNPRVSGPERQRLQQRLAGLVDQTYNTSPTLRNSQQRYDRAVNQFEAGRNSVVVSAGNEFDYLDLMARDAGGRRINAGENFTRNVLENEAVTSVGATRWFQNGNSLREVRAGYSSRGPGVDIYASGSLGNNNHSRMDTAGTSFAAPRVAATMAELHRRNPTMSSAQVERLMRDNLTHGLSDSRGQMEVLDHQRTADFLARGTF